MKSVPALVGAVSSAAFVALLSACAAPDVGKPAVDAKSLPEYRTGSHIPIRSSDPPATDAERERAADQIRSLQRTGNPKLPQG